MMMTIAMAAWLYFHIPPTSRLPRRSLACLLSLSLSFLPSHLFSSFSPSCTICEYGDQAHGEFSSGDIGRVFSRIKQRNEQNQKEQGDSNRERGRADVGKVT